MLAGTLPAQTVPGLQAGIDRFLAASRVWNGAAMEAARAELQETAARQPGQYEPLYWQGVAEFYLVLYYGLAESEGYDPDRAAAAGEAAVKTLKAAIDASPQEAECHAMLSCVYGFRIAAHPWTALWMGPRVLSLQRDALEHGPQNPRVHYLIGAGYQGAPDFFRNTDKARDYLERAQVLFEAERTAERGQYEPDWGYAECLGLLGDLSREQGDVDAARNCYQAALRANPGYTPAQKGIKEISRGKAD